MIKVENLVKTFGSKRAVDGISFSVERGEILGFLGPNGAGKSTTMRMVTGFLPPTAGTITVGGYNIEKDPILAKRLMGYLPENAPAYADMTVEGFLRFIAELRGLSGKERDKAVERAAEMCFLKGVLQQSVDTLSKGFRHRTCFAQSIVHDPEVLILDEPTDGLDPNQKHEVRNLIRRMGEKKVIIFSTHILEEVEAVCSRAIIIDQGKVVANGSPSDLMDRAEVAGAVSVKVIGVDADAIKSKLGVLANVRKASIVTEESPKVWARVYPKSPDANGTLARSVAEVAQQESWALEALYTEQGRLDEVFRTITSTDTPAANSNAGGA